MIVALASVALWTLPLAAAPGLAAVPDTQHIAGGEVVGGCGWPSVVLMRGNGFLCTGNLVHPEVVVTAAHCIEVMEPATAVEFGDTANTAQEWVDVDFCMGSPDFVSNGDGTIAFDQVQNDWGFCKLAEPATHVTPIPVIFGCELDLVEAGAEITRVGYGRESLSNTQFFKRVVDVNVNDVPFTGQYGWPTQLSEGGDGAGTCPGDSGGPSFIRVPSAQGGEDAWRMVAIQSTQPLEDAKGNAIECGDAANNTAVIAQGVEWIEEQSGVDITPCFDATTGMWDPTFACQGFPIDPATGGGSWAMGCEVGELSDFSGACGLALPEFNPDEAPPLVSIVEPAEPVDVDFTGTSVVISVVAEANDGAGWGIASVDLVIFNGDNDEELARFSDLEEAYAWEPEFPQGRFYVQAIGYDNAGLEAASETLEILIGVEADPGETTGDAQSTGEPDPTTTDDPTGVDPTVASGTGEPPDDDDASGTGGPSTPAGRGEDDSGCGCRGGDGSPARWGLALLGLLGLLAIRRRASD